MGKSMNLRRWILHFSIFSLLLSLPNPSNSSDPDPLQDFCIADLAAATPINGFPCKPASSVKSDDFFFSGLSQEGNTSNPMGSVVTLGNVQAFPGVNTLGLSMSRVDIAPGGVTYPHLHPRAAEIGLVVQGKIQVGLITSGDVVYSKNVSGGEIFAVPRGLVHFVMNVGGEKALAFIAYNSHLPGTVYVSRNLFTSSRVPDQVLLRTFQVNQTVIDDIRSGVSNGV